MNLTLSINHAEFIQFFERAFPEHWVGQVYIDILDLQKDDKTNKQTSRLVHRVQALSIKDIQAINPLIWNNFAQRGYHIFYTCSMFDASGRRKKPNAVGINFLFADVDNCDEKEMQSRLEGLPAYLYPTGIVNSGGGFHLYWVLRETVLFSDTDYGLVEDALRRVHAWVGGDTTTDITRLLRVPGTWTVKPWKYKEPRQCKFEHWVSSNKITLEQVLSAPILLGEIRLDAEFKRRHILLGEHVSQDTDKQTRSHRDFAVVKELLKASHTRDEIHQVCFNKAWQISSAFQEKGEDYFNYTFDAAVNDLGAIIHNNIFDDGFKVYKKTKLKNGNYDVEELSNFCILMQGVMEIVDTDDRIWDVIIVDARQKSKQVHLHAKDLTSVKAIIERSGVPGMSWFGNNADYQNYLAYLAAQDTPYYKATYVCGWHGESFVMPQETWFGEHIRYIKSGAATPDIEIQRSELDVPKFMESLHDKCLQLHKPSISVVALAWFLAAAHAPAVRHRYQQQFPHLCIHGLPGSGKSTLARILNQIVFGVMSETSIEASIPVFRRSFMGTNTFPVFIDEYEHSRSEKISKLNSLLRSCWNAGSAQHIEKTTGFEVFDLKLASPVVITGPSGIEDTALQDRAVNLRLGKFNKIAGQDAINWFDAQRKGAILEYWLQINPEDWITNIAGWRNQIDDTSRQQHCFGVVASVIDYLNDTYWSSIYTPEQIRNFWGEQKQYATEVTTLEILDVLLAYLIQERIILHNLDYWVTGMCLNIHQSKFINMAMGHSYKLSFPISLTRQYLTRAMKDLANDKKLLYYSESKRIPNNQTANCFGINLEEFPHVQQELY